jgi:hypothetical protein
MKYALLIYVSDEEWDKLSEEAQGQNLQDHSKFGGWLAEHGWMRGGEPLQPTSTATTVRVRNGETLSVDGPFAETKEHLAGFYLIECDNLDEAIEAASRIPDATFGSIEVRPVLPLPGGEDEVSGEQANA